MNSTVKDQSQWLAQRLLTESLAEKDTLDIYQRLMNVRYHLSQSLQMAATGWLAIRPAAAALKSAGINSVQHLKALLYAGVFVDGVHARNLGSQAQPIWQFNIPCCEEAIEYYSSLPPEERDLQAIRDLLWRCDVHTHSNHNQ